MKVLVLGGSGMLGHKLVQVLAASPSIELHATTRSGLPPAGPWPAGGVALHALDLSTGSAPLRRVIGQAAPDVVINAIGAIKQRDLDASPDEAFFLNATLPHLIPIVAPGRVRVVHFSTDCVFRGDRGGYTEADAPDVTDLYGRSKACGEITYADHLTLRTSIIGFEASNQLGLLSWLLHQVPGPALPGYTRAIFSGLPTITLARIVRDLVQHDVPLRGLYQVASEPISKFDLLQRISTGLGLEHHLRPDDTVAIDRSLDDSLFRTATRTGRPGWDVLVQELVHDYTVNGYAQYYTREMST